MSATQLEATESVEESVPDDAEPESGDPGQEEAGDEESSIRVRERTVRDTQRWKGVTLLSLGAGGIALVLKLPALLLAGVVGIGYAAYVRATEDPEVVLGVDREFGDDSPDPGDEVDVSVTVTNEGDSLLPDLRLVDGVPEPLPVVEGSPRVGTPLWPGESVTMEYTVRAKRGFHEFDHCLAVARDLSGETEHEVHVATEDRFVCTPSTQATRKVPLRALTSRYTGRVETDDGGEGVEFHATREYRPGDSLSRIDWNRHARTGELSTIEFRKERSATVVLLLDLREEAYVREDDEGLHAADRGVEGASRVFTALLETGDRVGVGTFSPEEVWLPPGAGNEHWAQARNLFGTETALSPMVPEQSSSVTLRVRQLRQRMPSDAQVILFSPLVDDAIVRGARLLDAHGHLVTIVSPDPTNDETPGQKIARVERAARMDDLRSSGLRVIDWGPDEHLGTAIDDATRRWST